MFNNTSRTTFIQMNSRNKIVISSLVIGILVVSGITLGVVLPKVLRDKYPTDSKLVFFNSNQNLAIINASQFNSITEQTLSINLLEFMTYLSINSFDQISVISEIDNSTELYYSDLDAAILSIGEHGFQLSVNDITIYSISGIAIDFIHFSVDIAPTIYQTLEFDNWETVGSTINFTNNTGISKAVIILLDSFGWRFWHNLSTLGIIDLNLNILYNQPGLTAYPSITNVATASILTGYWPADTSISSRQDHTLNKPSIFDVASANGVVTEIIEGNIGFININADHESWLPDYNGNGTNDDEIYYEAIDSLSNNRSELLFIHFHGIDDIGHTYGPYSSEWNTKVKQTCAYVNNLMNYIDNETIVILTADHGMHINDSPEDYRVGVHGESIWEDMVIPLIIARK